MTSIKMGKSVWVPKMMKKEMVFVKLVLDDLWDLEILRRIDSADMNTDSGKTATTVKNHMHINNNHMHINNNHMNINNNHMHINNNHMHINNNQMHNNSNNKVPMQNINNNICSGRLRRSGPLGIVQPIVSEDFDWLQRFALEVDLVVCPGLFFDHTGGRLGRGWGCYDKFFEKLKYVRRQEDCWKPLVIVGVAFEEQILHCDRVIDSQCSVPCDVHDVRMNFVITPHDCFECV
eukprot:CAMPEP_0113850830 /NCGR_PEP_ID=MMETSP0372-20130328/4178_1 /TAXON_ID=340204 /ORGANISM="Lankesteria abbotti" /LENGTH=233 /DNA_ID=CAMNT_0000821323 /DNA_START=84 /DNA_END=785 /DNA_ORIENTATION=- /assembly_acc=CAM_ASM_000359